MNVYEVGPDLAGGVLTRLRDDDDQATWERRYEAIGKPSAAGWCPPRLESPRGKVKVLSVDCVAAAMVSGADMLLNGRAREALAPLLLPCGEYLPVELDGLDHQWFNCTTLIDVADQERVEGRRSKYRPEPSDCWDRITRWAFHLERLVDVPLVFTVPQLQRILMCMDVLREAVEAGGVEIDDSPGQFFGEAGRQWNIAAKARRKAMQLRRAARSKERPQPEPDATPPTRADR